MNRLTFAQNLLKKYGDGAEWPRHCYAVAKAANSVGSVLQKHFEIDLDFLHAAALLHDIGRYATHHPILHGVEGYTLLMQHGEDDLAFVCASHVLFGLDAAEAAKAGLPARDFIPRTIEQQLVPLMDFLVEFDTPTTLKKRFASIRRRYAADEAFLLKLDRAENRARTFMRHLEAALDISVENHLASTWTFTT